MQLTTGSHGVITADAAGRITMLNDAARALLGLELRSVIGRSVKEIIPDTRLTDVMLDDRESKEEKISVGGKRLIVSRTPVYENARLVGSIFIVQDTSELEKVKEQMLELKQAKDELEVILNSSYDEIFVIDGKGITRKINKAGESFYGVDTNKMIGRNVTELEENGYFSPSVTRLVFDRKERATITQTTRSGKELIVTGNPVFDENGNITRVVVNSRDISELSSLRRLLKDTERLADNYRKQVLQLKSEQKGAQRDLIASSPQMLTLLEMVDKVAAVDSTVLITGESGVGKGVVAARIHNMSSRSTGPFVTINCGAIPENLLESELFGYVPGAFTGARKGGKKGLIEMGNGGTVFLDEIGELPLNLQVKLLHVIQQKNVLPVGGTAPVEVDVRFVAATNRDLKKMVQEGSFREDLFYRLNVIPMEIPPLRERREDVDVLLGYYLDLFNKKYGMAKKFTPEVREVLDRYSWPGNVREVENIVERLAVTSDGTEIKPVHLPDYVLSRISEKNNKIYIPDLCPLDEAVQEVEKQLLEKAFKTFGNTYRMAEALNINQSTVVRKMKKYLSAPKRRPGPKKQ
ncbi:PAS domain S-box-containing protein/intein N-terminal splicing region [Desulfotomaculum arcticum]|uniref:HTH-type transcriptional regulatory protein TyrR n=1 Tax=Desulfotruncus arcticus DSM 17038 TaxID=1121424 RepID=A0A1I2X2Q2_9FIRM|nr:sigma 54-interacting transcriptional regulator [Desulfotruncus arcticus]SFH06201.1 PAS domain S-box-containing protein/intein N-terminal splicing region [Desulfotomaculum arcticum] [Desulfotruncus arcticus DSM 17038]